MLALWRGRVTCKNPTQQAQRRNRRRSRGRRTPAKAGDNAAALLGDAEAAEAVGDADRQEPASGGAAGGSGGQPRAIRRLKPRGATPQAVAEAPKKLNFLNREGVAGIAQPDG